MLGLDRISIVCFASSYAIAFALEVTRLFFRLPVRFLFMIGFAVAAVFTQTVFLVLQTRSESGGVVLSSWYHWCLIAAWILGLIYLYQLFRRPNHAAGIFTLPVILGLLAMGYAAHELPAFSREDATFYWGGIHGMLLLLGTVVVSVGCVAGLMYLVQAWRLKHKLPPRPGMQLPSLETLQRTAERALVFSTILLAAGLLSGVVLNLVRTSAVSWSDPVVWTSGVLFVWLVAASLFNGLYRPARAGRKVAYLTIASFLFLALVLALTLFNPAGHGQPSKPAGAAAGAAEVRP